MRHKHVNPYDAQFDLLHKTLSEVKDIDKLLASAGGQRFLEFISVRQYELNGLGGLYKQVIIPAVNRNSVEQMNLWRKSRYSKIIEIDEQHFREDKYHVIRLAYVQLFHRWESFINDLFPLCEQLPDEPLYPNGALYEYVKSNLEVDLKRPSFHPTLKEVNFIANCVKHTNGLPTRRPVPARFKDLDGTVPLRIPDAELYKDMETIRNLMGQIVQQVLRVHQLLLYRGMISLGIEGPVQRLGVAATNLMESLLKREFGAYKAYYQLQP